MVIIAKTKQETSSMELRMTVYEYQSRPGIPTVNAKSFLHAKTQLPQNLLGLAGFIGPFSTVLARKQYHQKRI